MLLGLLVIYPLFPTETVSAEGRLFCHITQERLKISGSSFDGVMTFLAQIIVSVYKVRKRYNTVKHRGSVSFWGCSVAGL